MSEEPPKCFIRLVNVRTLTHKISVINIVLYSWILISMCCGIFYTNCDGALLICINRAISALPHLGANICLYLGVTKHNCTCIGGWLYIYVMLFISNGIKLIIILLMLVFMSDTIENVKWTLIIDDALSNGFALLCFTILHHLMKKSSEVSF